MRVPRLDSVLDPARDGVDHINAYSRGRTPLGRALSHFAYAPFTLADHGSFASVEAYWYWLSAPEALRDVLRPLYGIAAKRQGRALRAADWPRDAGFPAQICAANYAKITQNPGIAAMLCASTLPIVHYYVVGVRAVVPEGDWIWRYIEDIRAAYARNT